MKRETGNLEKISVSAPPGTREMIDRIIMAMLARRAGKVNISRVIVEAIHEKARKERA